MITFEKLAIRRGGRVLFSNAECTIHRGDKAGITGSNGAGKSSWFSLILGELEADEGAVIMPPGISIAHVAQETPALQMSAIDYVMAGDVELVSLQAKIAEAEQQQDGLRMAEHHDALAAIDGYSATARAASLMHGLGFLPDQLRTPLAELSGGWRMRLNLASALMCRSDVLLLDEPSNHLDLEAVIWLEQWLQQYSGAVLLISHDRDFLDCCVNRIIHIENQQVSLYTGNYTDFERVRAEKLSSQQAEFQKQQRQIDHMNDYIRRFRAQATKAKQAQSRIKALERMCIIAPAHVDSPFSFSFQSADQMPTPLLQLQRVDAGYGSSTILKKVSLSLLPGDRIGLLGPNGAGKSTLVRILADDLAPQAGVFTMAQGLRIAYFAQHQLEQLHDKLTPVQHLMMLDDTLSEKQCRNFLGGFAFHGDVSTTPVAPLSGGEKARLVLALMVYQKPHLLLLDEPTNHLDLEMRHALTLALQEFAGAVVLVSHDRHLLRTVCDELWLVAQQSVQEFSGDLDEYASWCLAQRKEGTDALKVDASFSKKDARRNKAELRKNSKPLRQQVVRLEKELEQLQQRQSTIEQELADPDLYKQENSERMKALGIEQKSISKQIHQAESAWLEASEELEDAS